MTKSEGIGGFGMKSKADVVEKQQQDQTEMSHREKNEVQEGRF